MLFLPRINADYFTILHCNYISVHEHFLANSCFLTINYCYLSELLFLLFWRHCSVSLDILPIYFYSFTKIIVYVLDFRFSFSQKCVIIKTMWRPLPFERNVHGTATEVKAV